MNWAEDASDWWCQLFGYYSCYEPTSRDGLVMGGSACLLVICAAMVVIHFDSKLVGS